MESCYAGRITKSTRYAIRKDTVFDRERLAALAARLPDGYSLGLLGAEDYAFAKEQFWCRDWVSQFADCDDYLRRGLGVVVKHRGEIVSGASSYSVYRGGIEIEIQTLEPHRRKGLACAAAAGLILECLNRGLYPSWDAANLWSVGLAEKLGYVYDHAYTAYYVNR